MTNDLITGILYRNSEKYGLRPAVYYQDDQKNWIPVSWSSLWEAIESTARGFLNSGIQPGDRVAIMSRNRIEWTVCDYALQLIRAVSVPLFSATSAAQATFILNETESALLLIGEQQQYDIAAESFQKTPSLSRVIAFDPSVKFSAEVNSQYFSEFQIHEPVAALDQLIVKHDAEAQKEDLCSIIYTSGTSGEPKGVMLTIGNFLHCIRIHDMRISISDKDVSLCFLPLSHIFERGWTFIVLSKGIRSYYLSNPKEVVEAVRNIKPTVMCSVPRFFEKTYEGVNAEIQKSSAIKQSLFRWAINVGGRRLDHIWNKKSVPLLLNLKYYIADKLVLAKGRAALGGNFRFMVCGGAKLPLDIIHFFEQVGIHIKIGYGLTETVATVTCLLDDDINTSSVGKVMPTLDVKIGDNNEILVKGGTIFKGYYKKPELTAEAFIDGYFRTGDAGHLDEHGYLFLHDRIKDIIKTSAGKYVAPQKIEAMLSIDRYIEQITLIGNERKYITALVVPSETAFKELAQSLSLQSHTPEEMVKHPAMYQQMMNRIEHLQKDLSPFEQVKKIVLLPTPFTIESGEMTSSLKIRRKIVEDRYLKEIERMYQDV